MKHNLLLDLKTHKPGAFRSLFFQQFSRIIDFVWVQWAVSLIEDEHIPYLVKENVWYFSQTCQCG